MVRDREELAVRLPEQGNMPLVAEPFTPSLEHPAFKKNRVVGLGVAVNAHNCVVSINRKN
jgi:hypothetical protein